MNSNRAVRSYGRQQLASAAVNVNLVFKVFVGTCAFFIPVWGGGWRGVDSWGLTCSMCHLSCRRYGSLCTCPWRGWAWTSRCWGRSQTGSCKHTKRQLVYCNIQIKTICRDSRTLFMWPLYSLFLCACNAVDLRIEIILTAVLIVGCSGYKSQLGIRNGNSNVNDFTAQWDSL